MVKTKCKFCGKEFEGLNEKQVNTQLAIHQITQHADKIKLKEIKK